MKVIKFLFGCCAALFIVGIWDICSAIERGYTKGVITGFNACYTSLGVLLTLAILSMLSMHFLNKLNDIAQQEEREEKERRSHNEN